MQWQNLNVTDWPADAIVALIEWVPDLTKTTLPLVLRHILTGVGNAHPMDYSSIKDERGMDDHILGQLIQWSDLIIFDYLTGNYDRVAGMQVRRKLGQQQNLQPFATVIHFWYFLPPFLPSAFLQA